MLGALFNGPFYVFSISPGVQKKIISRLLCFEETNERHIMTHIFLFCFVLCMSCLSVSLSLSSMSVRFLRLEFFMLMCFLVHPNIFFFSCDPFTIDAIQYYVYIYIIYFFKFYFLKQQAMRNHAVSVTYQERGGHHCGLPL